MLETGGDIGVKPFNSFSLFRMFWAGLKPGLDDVMARSLTYGSSPSLERLQHQASAQTQTLCACVNVFSSDESVAVLLERLRSTWSLFLTDKTCVLFHCVHMWAKLFDSKWFIFHVVQYLISSVQVHICKVCLAWCFGYLTTLFHPLSLMQKLFACFNGTKHVSMFTRDIFGVFFYSSVASVSLPVKPKVKIGLSWGRILVALLYLCLL